MYNENAIKRHKCKICGKQNYPDLEENFYRVEFTEKIDLLKDIPEYKSLKKGYYNSVYMCQGCVTVIFAENPETIQKIELVFP